MSKTQITSSLIKKLLNDRYADQNKSMIAFEVADGTGAAASRWADAISFELWPSNDYLITGYEIKISRADWLNELRQPEKSHAIQMHCDCFFLVAPQGVLKPGELPDSWGYIQATPRRLSTKIKATRTERHLVDKPFMASFLRKAVEKYQDKTLIDNMWSIARKEAQEDLEKSHKYELKRLLKDCENMTSIFDKFYENTGIKMNDWNFKQTVDAINLLQNYDTTTHNNISRIDGVIRSMTSAMENLNKGKAALEEYLENGRTN